MMIRRLASWWFAALALLTMGAGAGDAGVKIFVTNDVHGYVFEDETQKRIGYALLQGYVDRARAQGFRTVLMDAGDVFSGNTLAQYDAGVGVAELVGRLGYRVLAPGNHAFDYNASSGDIRYYTNVLIQTVAGFDAGPLDVVCVNLRSADDPLPHVTRTCPAPAFGNVPTSTGRCVE